MLLDSDSAVVHREIAEYMEKEYAHDLRPRYPRYTPPHLTTPLSSLSPSELTMRPALHSFGLFSLAYHFRSAGNRREEACKYAVKSADYALSRGAFNDGLVFALAATETSETRSELRVLLQVVEQALVELTERDKEEDVGEVVVLDRNDEVWTYETLRQRLQQQINQLKTTAKKARISIQVDEDAHGENGHNGEESQEIQRLVALDTSLLVASTSGESSPMSPIRLSWKPSYSTLVKMRGQDTAINAMHEADNGQSSTKDMSRKSVDTKSCCVVS